MKKITLLLFALISFMTLKAADPDFAHPKTTLDAAIKHYDAAISSPSTTNSGVTVIKSLLEIIGATSAIDPDSIVTVIPRVDRAIDAYSGADKAMLLTVKADLLNSIYSARRWTYDNMQTPDLPLPSDITEWNGRQFTSQIQSNYNSAFNLAASSPDSQLTDYKSVITADRTTFIYFPSVASFIALKACNFQSPNSTDFQSDIINRVLALSPAKSAPWFYWSIKRLDLNAQYEPINDETATSPLNKLFLDNRDCEEAGLVLCRIANNYSTYDSAPAWLLPAIENFIKRYPSFCQTNDLKNNLQRLTLGRIHISVDRLTAANQPISIKVTQYFNDNYSVKIYKLTENEFNGRNLKLQDKTPVKNIIVNHDSKAGRSDTTLTVVLNAPGYYVAVPLINGSMTNAQKAFFICSNYLPVLVKDVDPNAFIIANMTDGSPVKGIAVTEISKQRKSQSSRNLGKSNRDGLLKFTPADAPKENSWINYEYSFSDGRTPLKFPGLSSYANWGRNSSSDSHSIAIFLDREIYHPGDTVNWAAIVTFGNGEHRHTAAGTKIFIEFQDANHQPVDSISKMTDALGRVYGSFVAPETGLTGAYSLKVNVADSPKRWPETRTVTISDFKLPTFKIEDLSVERDTPAKGEVTLKGKAVTYSGMPVVAAKVSSDIWEASRWRWFSPSRNLGLLDAVTDDKGEFTVVVSDSLLSLSSQKCFVAKFTVTALSGEAQNVSKSFTTGKPYQIVFNGKDIINTDTPLTDAFDVYDADGKKMDIKLQWWLSADADNNSVNEAVASGTCNSSKDSSIDLSSVKSGIYYLSVEPVDASLADKIENIASLRLYSITKNTLPDDQPFLLLTNEYVADSNGEASIMIGSPTDNSYYYLLRNSGDKLNSIQLLNYGRGFHKINVALSDDEQVVKMWLIAVRNGHADMTQIEIKRPNTRKLTLVGSSMRDNLTPGSPERWTLKLSDYQNDGVAGGMIATMFNAALNSISPYNYPQRLFYYSSPSSIDFSIPANYLQSAWINKKLTYLKQSSLTVPEFNPAINFRSLMGAIRIRGTMAAADTEGVEEVAMVGYAMNKSIATADLAAGAFAEPEEIVADEEASEEESAFDNGSESVPAQSNSDTNFDYRDSEVLQAFWMPALTFNSEGEAEISFTVPNANTTWAFNAFAWTEDARSAKMMREFVASKPVMVQPNLPRFLRSGDKAQVLATVYNNTDSTAIITTVVEVFDIASGTTKSQFTSTDSVNAKGSAIVPATVIADGDVAAIGYRVRATLGRFTDGEQSFIPVIAASSDVIESENFYLNPGDSTVVVKIPSGKQMQSTLDYTANPAWNIIKELPGLATENSSISIGASRQLFGAATAAGLLRKYPVLADVLKAWSEDADSKALTSRLSQNDELKAAVLNSTPWVQAAASDTERMARLSLLFDRKATEKSIHTSIATLKKLQLADGGWSWGQWCNESSVWATNIVLQNLGRLNDIGFLPSDKDLQDMISKAIAYYEAHIPQTDKIDYSFTYITTLFPDVEIGLRGKQIVNATVNDMVANWKSSSTWHKAVEALILDRNNHKAVARQIIGSLSQFAVPSANKGTSFPSVNNVNDYTDLLYAFSRITPDSKLIDGMRQWLVLRQQTTTQLGTIDPTRLIAAFASSGTDWFDVKANSTSFSLGNSAISVGELELATGHVVYNLPATAAGKKLTINRSEASAVAAYGSVISRYIAESTKVKAKSCSDLSIEKRITALRDGRWQYVDEIQLGEQVRVLLTIKAKRDLQYVSVIDERPAAFEPVDQLPGWVWNGGAGFYRENRDSATNLFIDYLPKGTYQITVDMTATIAGDFTSGIATIQSQLAPSITAHSAGTLLHCK